MKEKENKPLPSWTKKRPKFDGVGVIISNFSKP